MNMHDLTVNQLKRAAAVKEQIESLNKELRNILGDSGKSGVANNHRTMSASARRKIAVAQKARWANLRRDKLTTRSARSAAKKKTVSSTTRAKLSAKLKRYWAAKNSRRK